jgi:hypothetical protein
MSIRIPLGRLLNVGGKSENRAKNIVCPAALAPSTVTVKTLVVADVEELGLKETATCVQTFGCAVTGMVADAKVWPEVDLRATVNGPLNVEPDGNL